jgi:hypothetical protein
MADVKCHKSEFLNPKSNLSQEINLSRQVAEPVEATF